MMVSLKLFFPPQDVSDSPHEGIHARGEDAIRQLIEPLERPSRRIEFR